MSLSSYFAAGTGTSECKVPRVTILFWFIKVLATTIGESAADALSESMDDLQWIFVAFFAIALLAQFLVPFYVPFIYWSTIVLVSVVGTLVTDLLTDTLEVTLWATTPVAAVLLGAIFALWFWSERTLAMHSIHTMQREAWYWLTVLFTFILGTALGDLVVDEGGLGYWPAILLFGGLFFFVLSVYYIPFALKLKRQVNEVLAFWTAYVLSRPFGASCGDFLSFECAEDPAAAAAEDAAAAAAGDRRLQSLFDVILTNETVIIYPCDDDMLGLDLGPGITSAIFGSVIFVLVFFLTVWRCDRMKSEDKHELNKSEGTVRPDTVGSAVILS